MNLDGTRVQAKIVFKQNEHAAAIPPVHDENGLPLPLHLGHPGHHSHVGAAQLVTVASLVYCSVPQLVSVASLMYCSMLSRAPAQVHGQPAHALSRGGVHHRVVPQGEHVQLESGHSGSYALLPT